MSGLGLGLALALVASLALNGSYVLQHAGSSTAPDIDARHPVRTLRALLATRLWTVGAAIGLTGWGIHIAALTHAPLSLVQAFVAGGLGLIAPIAVRVLHQSLTTLEWVAVAGVAVSLVMLSVGLHDPGRNSRVDYTLLAVFVAAALLASGALVASVRGWRAHALGLAGGILYGGADTCIKALTTIGAHRGIGAVVVSPWLAAAAVMTVCAFFTFQRGLQTGRAIPVVVLMTGATTVVAILGGFAVFGDPLGRTPLLAYLHVLGFVVVTLASALLAPATSVAPPERRLAASH